MAIDKPVPTPVVTPTPAVVASGIGFASGAIVANSVANTPAGGFTLKHGVKKITFDPSVPSITLDDGAGNTVAINASSVNFTDAGGDFSAMTAATLELVNADTSAVAISTGPASVGVGNGTTGSTLNPTNLQLPVGIVTIEVTAPATATSAGIAGQIAYDATYIYVCVATNTWVRAPLTTF